MAVREVHLEESIQSALDASRDGDEVVVEPGVYREALRVLKSVSLRAATTIDGRVVELEPPDGTTPIIDIRGDQTGVCDVHMDGRFQSRNGIYVQTYSPTSRCDLAGVTIRHTGADGIRLRRLNIGTVNNCLISHCLRWSDANGRQDAHGIASDALELHVVNHTVIVNCSGDSIQMSPNRIEPQAEPPVTWRLLAIDDCYLYQRPLEMDVFGFKRGQCVGENALDTKVPWGYPNARPQVLVRDTVAEGFRYDPSLLGSIVNASAWNIKEPCDAHFEMVTTRNCGIAYRLRGAGSIAEPNYDRHARVTGNDLRIENCDVAFRCEDGIHVATFERVALKDVGTIYVQAPSSRPTGFTLTEAPVDPPDPEPEPNPPVTRTFRGRLADDDGLTFDVVLTATEVPAAAPPPPVG